MIDALFDVSIDTPKYHRRGTLVLKSAGNSIAAELAVADHEPLGFMGTCSGQDFDFEGEGELPSLGKVRYKAHGSVWGNSVTVACETDAGKVELFGTRLSTAAGAAKSSHDYLMRASTGDVLTGDDAMYSGLYADGG